MTTHPVRLRDGRVREYCVVNDLPSLLWVANQAAIELHPFLARTERHDRPTLVMFDLDPGEGAGVLDCCRVALSLRALLGDLGLDAFVKTSGSLGLHVQVPLNTPHGYEQTKPFAREVAARLAAEDPRHVTDRTSRALRGGRVLVDWLANDASRSVIAPCSLRAADHPSLHAARLGRGRGRAARLGAGAPGLRGRGSPVATGRGGRSTRARARVAPEPKGSDPLGSRPPSAGRW